ncbi:MAG: hypothetical protein ACO1SV_08820 [Fimbriimonas sp.]
MLALLLSPVLYAAPPNLILNGAFEADPVGFKSQYLKSEELSDLGTFAIGTDPNKVHGGGWSMGDHTTGKGRMLIANGSDSPDVTLWQQTIKVAPGKTYRLTGWAASWGYGGDPVDPSPARLRVYVNGKAGGPVYALNAEDGKWGKFTFAWKSGTAKSAVIRIVDENLEGMGNDFAVDDLSFVLAK